MNTLFNNKNNPTLINGAGSVSDLLHSALMNPGGESPDFLSGNLNPVEDRSGAGNIGGLLAERLELGLRTLPRTTLA